jgi:hypothetical protein
MADCKPTERQEEIQIRQPLEEPVSGRVHGGAQ